MTCRALLGARDGHIYSRVGMPAYLELPFAPQAVLRKLLFLQMWGRWLVWVRKTLLHAETERTAATVCGGHHVSGLDRRLAPGTPRDVLLYTPLEGAWTPQQ